MSRHLTAPRVTAALAALALLPALAACADDEDGKTTSPVSPSASSVAEQESEAASEEESLEATPSADADAETVLGTCGGIGVAVDTGDLEATEQVKDAGGAWCVEATKSMPATEVLERAGIDLEMVTSVSGAICQVNSVPQLGSEIALAAGPYTVSCDAMPSADAYWSIWVRPAAGGWEYAKEGIETLTLDRGEALELLFTIDGAPAEPAS